MGNSLSPLLTEIFVSKKKHSLIQTIAYLNAYTSELGALLTYYACG